MKKIAGLFLSLATIVCLLPGCSKNDAGNAKGGTAAAAPDTAAAPTGPVELKVKWIPGKRYVEEMTMNQTMEMTMPGSDKPMETATEMTMGMSLSALKERPEGGAELELKFLSQKMSTKMAGQEVAAFDSASDSSKDGANPMAPTMRKMIGASVKFLTDTNGNIDQVEGYDDFMKRMTAGVPAQSQMMFKGMFSEDSLKQFGPHAQGLPDKPVKPGDSWPVNIKLPAGPIGKLDMSLKYKFESWEQHEGHNCVLLSYTGNIGSTGGTGTAGMNMSVDGGKTTGKSWFDPELGTMVDTAADQDMTLKMKVQGKDMNSRMKQHMTLKLAKFEDITK
jgi:hypothetical protein